MTGDFATTLEQCLSQVETERARVQSCLVSYPTLAGELEPLLRTAEVLRMAPKPQLSPEARSHIATLAFGKASPAARPERRLRRRRWSHLNRSWAFAALGVTLILAILGGTGLAYTATDALPGSVLYPVKRATEIAWLWVTPEQGEAALHLRLAERRLAETEALAQEGTVEPSVLEAMAGHVEAALGSARGMASEHAIPLLQTAVEFSSKEEQALARLMPQVSAAAQNQVQKALQVCREQGRRARGDIDARRLRPNEGLVPPGHGGEPPPGHGGQPPGQIATPPGQDVRPEGLQSPPGQEQIPPGQAKPGQDTEDEDVTDDKDEEKEEDKEEKEEDKEAADEDKEEDKEEKEEDKETEDEEEEDEQEEEEEVEEEEAKDKDK